MPELYKGQTQVVSNKLQECELLQHADEERLKAATDPNDRANILTRMAGRTGMIASYNRQLAKSMTEEDADTPVTSDREITVRLRLNEDEDNRLRRQAAEQGLTLSAYIRLMCGL